MKKLLLFLCICLPFALKASHYMGVDITYQCDPNNNNTCVYRIHHKTYYDCSTFSSGNPAPAISFTPTAATSSFCVSQPSDLTGWVFVSTGEVTPICPTTSTKCTNSSAILYGVREVYYIDDYDFCSVGAGCNYQIGWSTCCRNYSITSGASGNSIGTFNTVIQPGLSPCNSSPVFNNPPVPYLCLNQQFTFNQGAYDVDGDSLSYALISCYETSASDPVTYNTGFSSTAPMGTTCSVSIDPLTGDITMLPTTIQIGVMCVEVTEWRNGTPIGTVVRDMQITVINCGTNNLPVISGINNTTDIIDTVCVGQSICFYLFTSDDDSASQTMELFWDGNIGSATFSDPSQTTFDTLNGTNPTAMFCWTPTLADIGQNQFLVTAVDNNCPLIGQNQITIQIFVANGTPITLTGDTSICPGDTAMLIATGGTSYQWSTGDTNDTIFVSPSSTTTYTVSDTSSTNICGSSPVAFTVQVKTLPVVTVTGNDSICAGDSTVLTVTGADSYQWSNPVSTDSVITVIPSSSTTYVVSGVLDGCAGPSTNYPVLVSNIPVVNLSAPNGACAGDSIQLQVQGAVDYLWSTGSTDSLIWVQVNADSIVFVTGSFNNCASQPDTVTLSAFPLPDLTLSQQNVSCFGANDGNATVSVALSTPPLTILWNTIPIQSGPTAINLIAGNYIVSVVDSLGCSKDTTVTIAQPANALSTTIQSSATSCPGGNNGWAVAQVNGGTSPYSYSWNTTPVQNSDTAFNLPAGTWVVSIIDSLGCVMTDSVTVTQPNAISLQLTSSPVNCFGASDGSAIAIANGGTGTFTFQWNTNPVSIGDTLSNVPVGMYVVTASDSNGCIIQDSIAISGPGAPVTTSFSSISNVSCFGGSDGSATIGASGGTGPYSYSWNTTPMQVGATVIGLSAGSYICTITDSLGCTSLDSIIITEPTALSLTLSQTNVTCFGASTGSAQVTATGGTSPYSYSWNTTPVQTTATATNLSSGLYTVTITDSNNCQSQSSVLITQPLSGVSIVSSVTSPLCNSDTTGIASVIASGGTGTFTYLWNTNPVQANDTAFNLDARDYIVYVTDANNCVDSFVVTVTQPDEIVINFTVTSPLCFGNSTGFATANPTGGTGTFTYLWSTGDTTQTISNLPAGNYIVTVTDSNGCTSFDTANISGPAQPITASATGINSPCNNLPGGSASASAVGGTPPYTYQWNTTPVQTGPNAVNLLAGTYIVTITDAFGCPANATVNISQPAPITLSLSSTPILCFGDSTGTATVIGSGGTGPLTFYWNTIPVTIGTQVSNLPAGYIQVMAVDANQCFVLDSILITQPSGPLAIAMSAISPSCFGDTNGSATATPSGGTAPYTYSWNTSPIQTTSTITNLAIGTYSVTVTDANGCVAVNQIQVTEPALLTVAVSTSPIDCYGNLSGGASAAVSGGTGPYSYAWNTNPIQTTPFITNLGPGVYQVIITDNNGCTATDSGTVISPPVYAITNLVKTNVICPNYLPTATASIGLIGGTQPYAISWSSSPVQTGPTAINLGAGTYTVTITDATGCMIDSTFTIETDEAPIVDAGLNMEFCEGAGGIGLDATVTGGVSPYIYVWGPNNGSLTNPNAEDPIANPDSTTAYYFYAIGANGCQSNSDSMIVTVNELPVVDVGPDLWRCDNGTSHFVTATIQNPIGGYSVQWSPSLGLYCDTCLTTYATPDTTTVYCAVVTSLLTGCTSDPTTLNSQACLTFTVRPHPIADAGPDREICQFDSIQTCGIATSAGPQYTFAWSPNYGVNDSTLVCPTFSPPNDTWYTLVVTSNGCPSVADSVLISVRPTLTADAGQIKTICALDSVQLDGQYSGSSTATHFIWTPSTGLSDSTALKPIASPPATMWYYFTVYNGLCPSITDSVQVTVNPLPIANAGPDLQLCPEGDSIQFALATATSGLPPYTYLWQPASGLQNAALLNPNLKPDTTTLYTLTVYTGTNPNVCIDIDTVLVTVKPGLNITTAIDTNTICQGQAAQLTSTGGSGSAIFTWSPPIGLSTPGSANTLASPDTTTTYVLTVSEHGCTGTDSLELRVLTTPNAAFTASSTVDCAHLTVAFLNLSANGVAYEWTFGDGGISNQPSPVHTYLQSGNYPVTLVAIAQGGCADTITKTDFITIETPGTADFRSTPEAPVEVSLPNNSTVSFYDQSLGAITWTWDFGDGVSSTDRNPNHTFVKPGVYYVSLTIKSANGCESTIKKGPYTVFTPELFVPNVFTPNNDGFNDGFLTNYGGDEAFLLQIFDRYGTKFFQTTNKNEAWNGTNLNGSTAGDGVYFYTLKIGDRNYSGNVTLMR